MGPREVVGGGGASGSSSVGFSSSFLPLLVGPVEKKSQPVLPWGKGGRESKVRLADVPFLYSYPPIEFRYKLSPIREMDFA